MILKNNGNVRKRVTLVKRNLHLLLISCMLIISLISIQSTCKYSFRDTAPIPPEIKTFRVNYLENKAAAKGGYVNPQLSPQLTEKLKQKIITTTRLHQTNNDDAHYDINGYIDNYFTSTSGISNGNASTNRLTIIFHLMFKNAFDEKKNVETDLTRTFDFPANQTLPQAEAALNTEIIKNVVDEIFNKIFSNW